VPPQHRQRNVNGCRRRRKGGILEHQVALNRGQGTV
jgi:hypothetical protein